MARPKNTDSIIEALKRYGQKRLDGYKYLDTLVKGIWYNALPKDDKGQVVASGMGKIDLKAAQFIITMIEGKPVERKEVRHDVFGHYPEAERDIDLNDFDKVIEVKPKEITKN